MLKLQNDEHSNFPFSGEAKGELRNSTLSYALKKCIDGFNYSPAIILN